MLQSMTHMISYLYTYTSNINVPGNKSNMYSFQVEALAVQLTQREGELIQEKTEVKKLANFLKQVYPCMCLCHSESSLINLGFYICLCVIEP